MSELIAEIKRNPGKILLLFIPFLLLEFIAEIYLFRSSERQELYFRQSAEEFLERLALRGDEDIYALTCLRYLLHKMRVSKASSRPVLLHNFMAGPGNGLDLEIYGFDREGAIRPDLCHQPSNRWLIKTLYHELRPGTRNASGEELKRLERGLAQVFGYGRTLSAFRRDRSLVVKNLHRSVGSWLAWDAWKDGGLFVICKGVPPPATRLAKALFQEGATKWKDLVWGSGIPAMHDWEVGGPANPDMIGNIWSRFSRAGLESDFELDRFFVFRQSGGGRVFFAGFPYSAGSQKIWQWVVRFLAMAGFLGVYWFLILSGDRLGPIRRVSIALFLYAAMVPVAGMLLGSYLLLDGRAEVLGNQVQRFQMEMLNEIDGRFPAFLKTFGERVTRISSQARFPRDFPFAASAASNLLGPQIGGRLEFRGWFGEPLWNSHSQGGGMQALWPVLTRLILSRWAPRKFRPAEKEADRLADQMFADPDMGLVPLAAFPHTMLNIETGGKPTFIFWDVYPESVASAAVAVFTFFRERLVTRFVRQQIQERWAFQQTQFILGAYDTQRGGWLSRRFRNREQLVPGALQAALLRRPRSMKVQLGGERFFMTIVPARQLAGISLLALFPESAFQPALSSLRWKIGLGGLVAVLVALFLGFLISTRLLTPVANLEIGVDALRQRSFKVEIPVEGNDELSILAKAFNSMVEDMHELDVAKAVQAGLTQQTFPVVPGYDFYGFTQFAGNLGGDILDVRVLPDERVFILVGDVSGHGVGSALLMAFNKALVTLWARLPDPDPSMLFRIFDRSLRQGKGRGRFLAAFCGIIDPRKHLLNYVSGGHPYPFLRRKGGEICWIGSPAYPLASRREPSGNPVGEISIAAGDFLLFFTDGLVEGLDNDRSQFGYDALQEWLQRPGQSGSARAVVDELWKKYRQERPVNEDDITLLGMIRREDPLTNLGEA